MGVYFKVVNIYHLFSPAGCFGGLPGVYIHYFYTKKEGWMVLDHTFIRFRGKSGQLISSFDLPMSNSQVLNFSLNRHYLNLE